MSSTELQNLSSRPSSPLNNDLIKTPAKLSQYESVDNFQDKTIELYESKNQTTFKNYEIEIKRLNSELAQAKATINDLKSNETKLKER